MKNLIFLALAYVIISCQAQTRPSAEENKAAEAVVPVQTEPPLKPSPPNSVLHKAGSRGESSTGWLLSKHTFSFNNYYDPDRMNFGLLRVLNDDWVAGGGGFPMHSHQNVNMFFLKTSEQFRTTHKFTRDNHQTNIKIP